MGEVYRATDTNLGRQVAIKVLPDTFLHDPERLARFEREARTLASLNHPNIASIYGLEKADGIRGLVMELVEGPTLAERIAQGPIAIEEALPIAKQIAEALEAAHEQGISPERSEARQRQGASRRDGEGARFRPCESAGAGGRHVTKHDAIADDHLASDDDRRWRAARHRRVHESGTGPR